MIIFTVDMCKVMELELLFKQNKGFIKAKDLKKRNLYYQLNRMIEEGIVEKISTGLYKHKEIATVSDWFEVAKIVNGGIYCLRSACFYYGLSTDIPNEYQIAIEHTKKIVLPDYPNIKLFYWDKQFLNLGVNIINNNGHVFKIYDIEKTVCDVIRFRNKIDSETQNQVISNYFKRKEKNINLLYEYSKTLRIEKKVNEYLNLFIS